MKPIEIQEFRQSYFIDLNNSKLTEKEFREEVVPFIIANPHVRELRISGNGLGWRVARTIYQYLPRIKTLDISDNNIHDFGAFWLSSCPGFDCLNLRENGLTQLAYNAFLGSPNVSAFKKIDMRFQKIYPDGNPYEIAAHEKLFIKNSNFPVMADFSQEQYDVLHASALSGEHGGYEESEEADSKKTGSGFFSFPYFFSNTSKAATLSPSAHLSIDGDHSLLEPLNPEGLPSEVLRMSPNRRSSSRIS